MITLICTICRDSLCEDNLSKICSLPCGHVFHGHCVFIWFERSQTCPHCRVHATPDKVFKLYFEVTTVEDDQPSQQDLETELRLAKLALEDMDKVTKKLTEISTLNVSLRQELKVLNEKVLKFKTLLIDHDKQKEDLAKALNALKEERLKTDNLTKEMQKYRKIKKLLNGSIEEATDVIDSGTIDIVTMNSCYMTVKRNFSALVSADTKLKADYGSLYTSYQKLEKTNEELNEQLLIKNQIIESCKNEQKISRKRAAPEERTPSSSTSLPDKSNVEPTPKKKNVLPLRRSSREVPRVSAIDLLNMKSSKRPQFLYDGLGGHSQEDKFPAARLKKCKIVSNRKK